MSKQCSSEILSCIGNRDREPRNIFELSLPVYHGLGGMLGVFGLPEWVPSPPVPIICHLAIPTYPFSVLMAPFALASWFWALVYFGEFSLNSVAPPI